MEVLKTESDRFAETANVSFSIGISIYCYESEYGYGSCHGYGLGESTGYGDGFGRWIVSFCGQKVYRIDDVPTLIDHIHGNIAKGRILRDDLTTEDCYIVKQGSLFAHGETLRKAMDEL